MIYNNYDNDDPQSARSINKHEFPTKDKLLASYKSQIELLKDKILSLEKDVEVLKNQLNSD